MGYLTVERDGGVVTVQLDRPPVNALDTATYIEVRDTFEAFRHDREVRVVIFTAAGERAFIAGADLKEYAQPPADPGPAELVDPGLLPRQAMWAIYDCAVPVIGAINGPALGGGLAWAACCDVLVAAEGATFAAPEINVGLLGASSHLVRMVGPYLAREMFFSGRSITAEELHARGVISRVVPRDELMDAARQIAAGMADKSPLALRLAKESMNRVDGLPLQEGYRLEQEYTNRLQNLEDAKEARDAFFEKRPPHWRMR
ncbi:MAG: enoyl-CoA hydratase-related protein [Acidimicrobiales bacterium]